MSEESSENIRTVCFAVNEHDVRGRNVARVPKRRKFAEGPKWLSYQTEAAIPTPKDQNPPTNEPLHTFISPLTEAQFTPQTQKLMASQIGAKLCSYKHQDMAKKKYTPEHFVRPEHVWAMTRESGGRCFYCERLLLFVYEHVRDPGQWTLERIDNARGHIVDNVVLACLSCNLRRGTMHSNRFLKTRQMRFSKEGTIED